MPPKRNAPRFLDYRRSPLPLDVALSFAVPSSRKRRNNEITNNTGRNLSECQPYCKSSSDARALVLSGRVRVNNVVETNCHRLVHRDDDDLIDVVDEDDAIERNNRLVPPISMKIAQPRYFVCYKPRGVVCSSRRNEGIDREDSVLISEWFANVFMRGRSGEPEDSRRNDDPSIGDEKIVPDTTKLFHERATNYNTIKAVGRLDEESEGLLLLTNDGSFSRLLCDPEFGLKKTYRVVVRGSGYGRVVTAGRCKRENQDKIKSQFSCSNNPLAQRIAEMIERGNRGSNTTTSNDDGKLKNNDTTTTPPPQFPYESCRVLDVGKLPSQHPSDDSYHALIDLVLREGKRHAVRRIIKNSGSLRVRYLSRVEVEGLEGAYNAVKPETIAEAWERGLLPGGRHRTMVPAGKLVFRSNCGGDRFGSDEDCRANADVRSGDDSTMALLQPGNVMELRRSDVDRIFALRM